MTPFSQESLGLIERQISLYGDDLEVELRFRNLSNAKFSQADLLAMLERASDHEVTKVVFRNVLGSVHEEPILDEEGNTVTTNKVRVRKRIILSSSGKGIPLRLSKEDLAKASKGIISGKTSLEEVFPEKGEFSEYGFKLALSAEPVFLGDPEDAAVFFKKVNRDETVTRYEILLGDSFYLDLSTRVSRHEVSHDVELEVGDLSKLSLLESYYQKAFSIVTGSEMTYTRSERRVVEAFITKILGSSRIINGLRNPINLHLEDMMWGKLLGNNQSVVISPKADGTRQLVVILQGTLWLVLNGFNRVKAEVSLEDGLFEGEMIPLKNRVSGPLEKYWILLYDTLFFNPDVEIGEKNYLNRLKPLKFVADALSTEEMKFDLKPFTEAECGPRCFFRNIASLLDKMRDKGLINFKTDGLVFTPINMAYTVDRFTDGGWRPEIFKWKPLQQMTVDLWVGKDGHLYEDKEERTLFPFPSKKPLVYSSISGGDKTRNVVVEVGLSHEEVSQPISEKDLLVHRIRLDKPYPNHRTVIKDTWGLMLNPISERTLRGETTRLLRKYHNRVKKSLLESPLLFSSSTGSLVDIGSGNGGDLAKWRRFSKILCIEPDPDHVTEFKRRVDSMYPGSLLIVKGGVLPPNHEKKRIVLFQGGIEKEKEIASLIDVMFPNGVDVVSSMLSMSLTSQESVSRVLKKLKVGGKFIFLTIYGPATRKFGEDYPEGLSMGEVTLRPEGENSLFINIENSIVQNQVESPPSLNFVQELLGEPTYLYRTDQEHFLSETDRLLAPLYVYGMFTQR